MVFWRWLIVTLVATWGHAAPAVEEPPNYQGAQVLRVKAVSAKQRDSLKKMQSDHILDIWKSPVDSRNFVDIMVFAKNLDLVKNQLQTMRLTHSVMMEDVKAAIKVENKRLPQAQLAGIQSQADHLMTWQNYHRISDINGYLDYLATTYPNIVKVISIGNSIEGRPINLVKISSTTSSASTPAFFIDGGIHAREWISPASVTYVIKELVENRAKYPWSHYIEYNIVPVLNPDGYEYTHTDDRLWRKNRRDPELGECAGTDLNRNFDYHWGGQGTSDDPCEEIYTGAAPFSEPETEAVKTYLTSEDIANVQAYITFHSYGQAILYPWGYDKKAPKAADTDDLLRVGRKMSANIKKVKGGTHYLVGNSAKAYYAAAGTSDDWVKAIPHVKFVYTMELRDKRKHGFMLPASEIVPSGKDALEAIKTISAELIPIVRLGKRKPRV